MITLFVSAITIHKGFKVTNGAIERCEEKTAQTALIVSIF